MRSARQSAEARGYLDVNEPPEVIDQRLVRAAGAAALADAQRRGPTRLGVPRIGAGLGGLAWPDVAAVLQQAGDDSTEELIAVSLPIP